MRIRLPIDLSISRRQFISKGDVLKWSVLCRKRRLFRWIPWLDFFAPQTFNLSQTLKLRFKSEPGEKSQSFFYRQKFEKLEMKPNKLFHSKSH